MELNAGRAFSDARRPFFFSFLVCVSDAGFVYGLEIELKNVSSIFIKNNHTQSWNSKQQKKCK